MKTNLNITHTTRKSTFCICENKGLDQLRCNRAADLGLCFCYIDNTSLLLPNFKPLAMAVQLGLCQTLSETP